MNPRIQFKTTTLPFLIPLVLVCLACLPSTQAVSPAPDGGYPGYNTAEGLNALAPATPGVWNTAIGAYALSSSVPGGLGNTAVGLNSLRHNTTGDFNIAVGVNSLLFNSTGSQNVAIGYGALFSNTLGIRNTANGYQALASNEDGVDNTATGFRALFNNTVDIFNLRGHRNTADGSQALFSNRIGRNNTATGYRALYHNTEGSENIALGFNAGSNITIGNFNIDIGNAGLALEQSTIRVGTLGLHSRTFIAGIYNVNQGGAPLAVTINANGQLGTQAPSSRRFKNEIKPMEQTSEAILALKPVTFHYKSDSTGTPQFGLVAEEVAEVNPDLVVRDENGEIYTVRYDAVNAMLLNEFLKEHRTVQELRPTVAKQDAVITQLESTVAKQGATIAQQRKNLEAKVAQQQKEIQTLTASLKEQASQIQKVSAALEVSKPAPQTVLNNQ